MIVGKPNVGKSSLLNILVGEERAIVTDIAGTTRDILEETVVIGGIMFRILDTAGIRSTRDAVEKIGVERAQKAVSEADLILYVVDSSVPFDENDRKVLEAIRGKRTIVLLNKSDLTSVISEETVHSFLADEDDLHISRMIKTSMKDKAGIQIFMDTVREMFFHGDISYHDEVYITNARHKEALEEAHNSLIQVEKSIEDQMPEDFYTIDMMSAYASLGKIIGEEVGEDLVNEIFGKFCMGK